MLDGDDLSREPRPQSGRPGLLLRDARTANTFTAEPVTDEQLATIHDLVKWGPTAANSQPLPITAVRSDATKARLLPLMSEGNRGKVEQAPVTLLLTADLRFYRHWDRVFPPGAGGGSGFAENPAGAEAFARTSAALQIGYLILGSAPPASRPGRWAASTVRRSTRTR